MLKFVSKNENEKKSENLIKEELEIKTSLLDFLSQPNPVEIKEKIYSSVKDIKLESRKNEMFYTKLLYYFSIIVDSKTFAFNDKIKKCIDNLFSICEKENEKFNQIYEDLYNLFSEEEISVKKYVLTKILESDNSDIFIDDQMSIKIFYLVVNFVKLYNGKYTPDLDDLIEKFASKVQEKKNYHLLTKVRGIEILLKIMKENKDSVNKSTPQSKLFFFLNMSNKDLVVTDLKDNLNLNSELKNEIELIKNMNDREDAKILFDYKLENNDFNESYGNKGAEIILIGGKECSIQQVLDAVDEEKKNVISFKEMIEKIYKEKKESEEEVQTKFEEIEDIIISGNEKKLFTVIIDYDKKEIKILYIRKKTYGEAQKKNLLDKVKKMKTNLEMILNAINEI